MNKKTLITIIIIIILILVAAGLIYWFWQGRSESRLPDFDITPLEQGEPGVVPLGQSGAGTVDIGSSAPKVNANLLGTLYYFTERFGTYSSQSEYQNIRDLKGVVTDDFYNDVLDKIPFVAYEQLAEADYQGWEAKVVKIVWESQSEQEARALVTVNRRFITAEGVETYPQDIRINFVKENGNWLAATAVWQERQ